MNKIKLVILVFIFLIAFFVRLHGFSSPLADWHAWRQTDTSAVSRTFVQNGFHLLHPRYNDISNIQSGMDNPQGYRFVEFPIFNLFQAALYKYLNFFSLEQWGRLVTIVSSLFTIFFIYQLVKKYADPASAVFAAAFYAFLPYNIYFGRVILPDPLMVMSILAGIYFFDKWLTAYNAGTSNNWIWFTLSLIFTASAFLIKPFALFFTLPMLYIAMYKLGFGFYKKWQLYIFLALALLPLVLWRVWMTQYPQGIPVSDWLFNQGNIRFKGAYFYWIFAERIGKLILGYWGLIILGFGFLALARKRLLSKNMFFVSFIVSSLLYLFVIARGNVQHDYYQILISPTLAMLLGLGSSLLLNLPREYFYKSIGSIILFVSGIFSIIFGWYYVRDFFNINNPAIIVAGDAVDRLTPPDAKVIAILPGSEGDTTFLYHTNRLGWPSLQKSIPELREMGADYLVIANPKESDLDFQREYKIVASSSAFLLFNLNSK